MMSRTGGADIDVQELLRLARLSFVAVQDAWDRADVAAIGALATSQLMADLQCQLAERGTRANHTEVLELDARLLGWEELHEAFVASVEFSGLIREGLGDAAAPFRELWLLASMKPAAFDWKLARVQSLS
jgi:predicted lipid-binding transport protein (Tim44 family)